MTFSGTAGVGAGVGVEAGAVAGGVSAAGSGVGAELVSIITGSRLSIPKARRAKLGKDKNGKFEPVAALNPKIAH
jgi:hypothetical protein